MKASDRQRGLTLVELMVSMAISVAILSSLVYVYVGSRSAYRANEALARVQETGRFALEFIARDLRQAGYMGCISRNPPFVFYSDPKPPVVSNGAVMMGYEEGAKFVNPTTIKHLRGDVIAIPSIDMSTKTAIEGHVGSDFKVANNCPGFQQGDFLMAVDPAAMCARLVVFTLTNNPDKPKADCATQKATLTAGSDKNSPLDGDQANPIKPNFTGIAGAYVVRFGSESGYVGYFIGYKEEKDKKRPTLYRFNGTKAEAVAENVEDLDLLFGFDSDGDGAVGPEAPYYRKASEIKDEDWGKVISVRVSLVAVSADAAKNIDGKRQVIYLREDAQDAGFFPDDPKDRLRLRQVFTTTVALRNRLP